MTARTSPPKGRSYRTTGYTRHAARRVAQRWAIRGDPPAAADWTRAFEAPTRWCEGRKIRLDKGHRCMATRDALAIMHRQTVITVVHVGYDAVDDLRATLLCRAMGLDAPLGG